MIKMRSALARTGDLRRTAYVLLLLCAAMAFGLCGWTAMAEDAPRVSFPDNPKGVLTALEVSEDYQWVRTEDSAIASSITHFSDDWFIVSHYRSLRLVNVRTGEQRELEPEHLDDCEVAGDLSKTLSPYDDPWNPTGVYYDKVGGKLYIANYNGHNILVGDVSRDKFTAKRMIVAEGLTSPENVALNEDATRMAVADYDGGKLFLFDGNGQLLWSRDVAQAHGVEIGREWVYCTSLTTREIVRFDYEGNEAGRVGRLANKGVDGYMWPVGLELCGDRLIVSDAHTSRLTVLDEALNYQTVLGCYGPYANNFNYPYSTTVKGDTIYVTDTFAARIIMMDMNGRVLGQLSRGKPMLQSKGEEPFVPDYPYDTAYLYESLPEIPASLFCPLYEEGAHMVSGFSSLWVVSSNGNMVQIPVLKYTSDSSYLNERLNSELYNVYGRKKSTDAHDYYVIGSPQSDLVIFFCEDMGFGGIAILDKDDNGVFYAYDGIGNEDLPPFLGNIDRLTNEFSAKINAGEGRYQAYVDVFLDYFNQYREKYSSEVPPLVAQDIEQWIWNQCEAADKASDIRGKIKAGNANYYDYLRYAADSVLKSPYEHPIAENIMLRTLCGTRGGVEKRPHMIAANEAPFYPDNRLENALDGDSWDDYSAMLEEHDPVFSILSLDGTMNLDAISVMWESEGNFAKDYTVELIVGDRVINHIAVRDQTGQEQLIIPQGLGDYRFNKLRFRIDAFEGQDRVLLRGISVVAHTIKTEAKGLTDGVITANEAASLCREVSRMLSYGVGPQIDGRQPDANELREYGEGHCGEYCYLFCRELAARGVTGTTYGTSSQYVDGTSADHSIVEVQTTEGKWVFDPTYGGYYTADMETLLACDNVLEYAVGFDDVDSYYCTHRFFSEARAVTKHLFIRDEYDLDLLVWTDSSVRGNLPSRRGMLARDESLAQSTIAVTFSQPQAFYRVRLSFAEPLPEAVALSCLCKAGDGDWSVYDGRLTHRQYELEYCLDAPVTVDQIQLSISAGSDDDLTLIDMYVYQ